MGIYDFKTVVNRRGTGSYKWMQMYEANPDVPPDIQPFSVADMDFKLAPEIADGLKACLDTVVLGYTQAPPSFTEAVIGWMQRRHRWNVKEEDIVLSPGVVPAIFDAVRAFTEPGDGVIIQTPAYYPFYMAIEKNERQLVRNPLVLRGEHYEIDFDQLAEQAANKSNKLLIFCSPHNPTGRVWTRDELQRVADIVLENDLVLFSDEIHFDLVMPGHAHTVMATVGAEIANRTIVATAPSKTFNLAGMATSSLMIHNEELREQFQAAQEKNGFMFLNTLGYKACELAYNKGEPWLKELLELIQTNHELVRAFMQRELPAVRVFDLEGTYLQWMDFRGLGKTADELQELNEKKALVFFDEGAMFGPEGEGFERLHLASPTASIEAALERLAACYAA